MAHRLKGAGRAQRRRQKPIQLGDRPAAHYKSIKARPVCHCPPEFVCQGHRKISIATVQLQHVACAASSHTPSPTQHFLAHTCHNTFQSGWQTQGSEQRIWHADSNSRQAHREV